MSENKILGLGIIKTKQPFIDAKLTSKK